MAFGSSELKPSEKVELFSRFYVLSHNGANDMATFQHGLPDSVGYSDFSDIAARLGEGTTLASALEMTGMFSQFDIAAMRVAEAGGNFDSVLKDLANHYATIVGLGL